MRFFFLFVLLPFAGRCSVLKGEGSPVEQVITLLQDLQARAEDEGAEEAKTYDNFACFCKDTTKEKSEAVEADQMDIDTHSATLEEKSTLKAELQEQLEELDNLIASINKDMNDAQSKRDAERTKYEVLSADLEQAVTSLEGAVQEVKHSMDESSLVQVRKVVRQSLLVADALQLSPKHQRTLQALLQNGEEDDGVPESDFEYHGDDLMQTMDELDKTYVEKKDDCEAAEKKAIEAHNSYMAAKTNQKETAEKDKDKKTEDLEQCLLEIGEAETHVTDAKAKLQDDETYLKDLTSKCELKAREWDQRSKMRADELTALSQALAVITDRVQDKETVNERAFVQKEAGDGASAAPSEQTQEDDDTEDDENEEEVSFLQKRPRRAIGSLLRRAQEMESGSDDTAQKDEAGVSRRHVKDKVIDLLKTKGAKLGSPILTSMAMKVAADPFAKVKALVEDLVNKLLEEANDEATQKGWCDQELGKAKTDRDAEWTEVRKMSAQLEGLEAERDRLSDDVTTLGKEIVELNDSLKKMTENRETEKEENTQTLKDAREGRDAVAEAINILEKFYKGAAKADVELLQERRALRARRASPVDPDAPDVASGAYQGNQAASGGILGLLAVIKSDFERTVKVTTQEETEAARAFAAFSKTTKTSISAKETEVGTKKGDLAQTEASINDSMEDLETHQKAVDDALLELESLKPACIDTGMSYEDRVAKRQEEIDALKNALCVLDTEGKEEGCK